MSKWKPKKGQDYWYLNFVYNIVFQTSYMPGFRQSDKERIKSGNCFRTKREAVTMLRKIKALLKKG